MRASARYTSIRYFPDGASPPVTGWCASVGLEATLEETQRLLKQAGYAPLYPRRKRESIIAHGIVHRTPLGQINDKLFAENEKTLF